MVSKNIAGLISFFLPGIGQVVQGKTKQGIIIFIVACILTALVFVFTNSTKYMYSVYFFIGIIAAATARELPEK